MTEETTAKKKRFQNDELAAMSKIDKIIKELPYHAGLRVLEWCQAQQYDRDTARVEQTKNDPTGP